MIQRIQTLYLLLVVILGTLLCFFSPVQFLTPEATEYVGLQAFEKWPMAVMTLSIPLLALVTIFLFRKRLLQARLNVMNVILCLGYYALVALYTAFVVKGYESIHGMTLVDTDWYLTLWAAIPLVNIVLTMMATRRILKDEALVRAGVTLDNEKIVPDAMEFPNEDRKHIGLEIHSGQNRVVRRMFEKVGYKVTKLDRVSFAGLTKKNVARGKYRFLTPKEVAMLQMGAFE